MTSSPRQPPGQHQQHLVGCRHPLKMVCRSAVMAWDCLCRGLDLETRTESRPLFPFLGAQVPLKAPLNQKGHPFYS